MANTTGIIEMTDECAVCECWRNTSTEYGCAAPWPIDRCEAYRRKYEQEGKEN